MSYSSQNKDFVVVVSDNLKNYKQISHLQTRIWK